MYRIIISVILILVFNGCFKDDYFRQIYDQQAVNTKFDCLKLKLSPYNDKIYNNIQKLYKFNNQCNNTLQIKYKTNIACNSPYNTNKQFHSFVELDILKNDKLIFTIYKDLKDQDDIITEIKEGYKQLCKTINL